MQKQTRNFVLKIEIDLMLTIEVAHHNTRKQMAKMLVKRGRKQMAKMLVRRGRKHMDGVV